MTDSDGQGRRLPGPHGPGGDPPEVSATSVARARRWSADPLPVLVLVLATVLTVVVLAPDRSLVLVLLAVVASGLSLSGST